MAVYYIDPLLGREDAAGLSECDPKTDWRGLALLPGDTVLLRRGRRRTYRSSRRRGGYRSNYRGSRR